MEIRSAAAIEKKVKSSRVKILFFGATAEIVATRQIELAIEQAATSKSIFEQLVTEYPSLANHRLHYSVNQQYATGEEIIHDGDELAIFTAVSGG